MKQSQVIFILVVWLISFTACDSYAKNNSTSNAVDSTSKKAPVSLEKKQAIKKYNRVANALNSMNFSEVNKNGFYSYLDSLDDLCLLFPEKKKDMLLAKAFQLHEFVLMITDSTANKDSLSKVIEYLYLSVLQEDSLNEEANYNLSLEYYNQATQIKFRNNEFNTISNKPKIKSDRDSCWNLLNKSFTYLRRAANARHNLKLLDDIIKTSKEIFFSQVFFYYSQKEFVSCEDELALCQKFVDSIECCQYILTELRNKMVLNFLHNRISKINTYQVNSKSPFNEQKKTNKCLENLNESVLKIDSLDYDSNYALFNLHYNRLKNLIYEFYLKENPTQKDELKLKAISEFENAMHCYEKYNRSSNNTAKLYLKEKDGYYAMLKVEEKIALKKKWGAWLVISDSEDY